MKHTSEKIVSNSKEVIQEEESNSNTLKCEIISTDYKKVELGTVHLDYSITVEAFFNYRPSLTIHELAIECSPGFAIAETPLHLSTQQGGIF